MASPQLLLDQGRTAYVGVASMSAKAHGGHDNNDAPRSHPKAEDAAAIAHDFRNMLQCATSAVRISEARLRRGYDSQVVEMLGDALAALDRAAALAHRLVMKQAGAAELEPVSIAQVVFEMRSLLRHAIGPGICFQTAIPEILPAVACIRADLENALVNLAINAREAMPKGGRLFIKVCECLMPPESLSSGRAGIKLSISDTGCGMSPSVREHVLAGAVSTKGFGRGIGLSTIERFARALGGTLELSSIPAGGTCIKLFLPALAPVLVVSNLAQGED
jgi:signal transduction histidine kinase